MISFFFLESAWIQSNTQTRFLRNWVSKEKPYFGILLETSVQQENYVGFCQAVFPGWKSFANHDRHPLGRIWFCRLKAVEVMIMHHTKQIISCAITVLETQQIVIVSAVYAYNTKLDRRHL